MADQKRNYQKELDRILTGLTESGQVPRLLLHACCAPCSSYVLEYLSDYFEITVFFYNPNIAPAEEYLHRAAEVRRLIKALNPKHPIHFLEGEDQRKRFYDAARGLEDAPEGGARCEKCFRLRLFETARTAKEQDFDWFTTTLTISPLKNAALLNEIGAEAGDYYGIPFLPSDFKKRGGYQRSIELSREYGLYRQNFCGCIFSKKAAETKARSLNPSLSVPEFCERTAAYIDLDRIRHNVQSVLKNVGRSEGFVAVIKADGYGHGAAETAAAVSDLVWGFAVATADEALSLRKSGITKPILVLGRVMESRFQDMIRAEIRIPVFEPERAEILSKTALSLGKNAIVHLKLDTGMHRIGFPASAQGLSDARKILSLPGIQAEGIFTHLATADMIDNSAALQQIESFRAFTAELRREGYRIPLSHYANSAASILLCCQDSALMRVGIALYGLNPSDECDYSPADLQPALSWRTEISFIKTLPSGAPISYGGTFVTDREMRVATLSVGYADGYPRSLSNRGEVLIFGKRCRILGRVCMDQMMVDVSEVPEASEGSPVTLIGSEGWEEITMEELGALSGRFNYELACDISTRVPRVYLRDGRIVSVREPH